VGRSWSGILAIGVLDGERRVGAESTIIDPRG